jgi:hypothetical protein
MSKVTRDEWQLLIDDMVLTIRISDDNRTAYLRMVESTLYKVYLCDIIQYPINSDERRAALIITRLLRWLGEPSECTEIVIKRPPMPDINDYIKYRE